MVNDSFIKALRQSSSWFALFGICSLLVTACAESQHDISDHGTPGPTHAGTLGTSSAASAVEDLRPSPVHPTPTIANLPPPAHYGAATASLEKRIYSADIIVRASLLSVSNGKLRFKAIEYLKGSGFTDFVVSADTVQRNTA